MEPCNDPRKDCSYTCGSLEILHGVSVGNSFMKNSSCPRNNQRPRSCDISVAPSTQRVFCRRYHCYRRYMSTAPCPPRPWSRRIQYSVVRFYIHMTSKPTPSRQGARSRRQGYSWGRFKPTLSCRRIESRYAHDAPLPALKGYVQPVSMQDSRSCHPELYRDGISKVASSIQPRGDRCCQKLSRTNILLSSLSFALLTTVPS